MCHLPLCLLRFKIKYPSIYLGCAICLITTLVAMLCSIVLAPMLAITLWSLMILGLGFALSGLLRVFYIVRVYPDETAGEFTEETPVVTPVTTTDAGGETHNV